MVIRGKFKDFLVKKRKSLACKHKDNHVRNSNNQKEIKNKESDWYVELMLINYGIEIFDEQESDHHFAMHNFIYRM